MPDKSGNYNYGIKRNFMKGHLLSAVGQAAKLSDMNESVASEFVSDERAIDLIAEAAFLGPVKGK